MKRLLICALDDANCLMEYNFIAFFGRCGYLLLLFYFILLLLILLVVSSIVHWSLVWATNTLNHETILTPSFYKCPKLSCTSKLQSLVTALLKSVFFLYWKLLSSNLETFVSLPSTLTICFYNVKFHN